MKFLSALLFASVALAITEPIIAPELDLSAIQQYNNTIVSTPTNIFTVQQIAAFFTPPLPYLQAAAFCQIFGFRLASVTTFNFLQLVALLRNANVPIAYIGSWNGDNYGNAGIALFAGGTINVPAGAPFAPFPGLCLRG